MYIGGKCTGVLILSSFLSLIFKKKMRKNKKINITFPRNLSSAVVNFLLTNLEGALTFLNRFKCKIFSIKITKLKVESFFYL